MDLKNLSDIPKEILENKKAFLLTNLNDLNIYAQETYISNKYKRKENGNNVYQDHTKLFQLIKDVKDMKGTIIAYSEGVHCPVKMIDDHADIYDGYFLYYIRKEPFPKIEILPFKTRTVFR